MTRMTPVSFSRRTRCRVAAGDRPTIRASSTLVRSASSCSAVSSYYVNFIKVNSHNTKYYIVIEL